MRPFLSLHGSKAQRVATLVFRLRRASRVRFTVVEVFPLCRVIGSFTVRGHAGINRFRFNGRVHGTQLDPGTYQIGVRSKRGRLLRVTIAILDAPVASPSAVASARERNVCGSTGVFASFPGATLVPPVDVRSSPEEVSPASSHHVLGVVATAPQALGKEVGRNPFAIAALGLAVFLLVIAAVPQAATPGGRAADLLVRERAAFLVGGAVALTVGVILLTLAKSSTGASQGGDGGIGLLILLPLLAVGIATAVVLVRRRNFAIRWEGAGMSVFRRDRRQGDSQNFRAGVVGEGVRLATAADEAAHEAAFPAAEWAAATSAERESEAKDKAVTTKNIGEHVAAVLQSAQAAAREIEDEARHRAAAIRDRARREAEEMRDRTAAEVAQQQSEAERVLREAREQAQQTRADADQFAEERRRETETRAKATIARAKETAASIADEAKQRCDELQLKASITEDRLGSLSAALRGVASELDVIVEGTDEAGDAVTAEREPLEESLQARAGGARGAAATH